VRFRSKSIFLISVILITASNVSALGYFDSMRSGTALPGIDPISISLGGVRSIGIDGSMSILTNPSALTTAQGTSLSISIGPAIMNEVVEDSLGRHTKSWPVLADLSLAGGYRITNSLVLGIAFAKITDMSFEGQYYIPDMEPGPAYGEIIAVDELKVTGGLFESVAGVSWMPAEWLAVGLSSGVRFGEANYDSTYEDRVTPSSSSDSTWGWKDEELCWHAGVTLPFEMSSIGISWVSSGEHYDSRITAGGMVYTESQSFIGAEVEVIAPGDKNAIVGRLFGQVNPSETYVFRGALFFADRGDEVEREGLGVSAGVGIALGQLSFNGAFSWSSTKRDSDTFGHDDMDLVKDSQSILSIGLSWIL